MKSLLIETVTNGWIVKAYDPRDIWSGVSTDTVAVFNKVEDLQAALPALLIDPQISDIGPSTFQGMAKP